MSTPRGRRDFAYRSGGAIEFVDDATFETMSGYHSHGNLGDGLWWRPGTYARRAPDFGRSFHEVTVTDVKRLSGVRPFYVPARRLRPARARRG